MRGIKPGLLPIAIIAIGLTISGDSSGQENPEDPKPLAITGVFAPVVDGGGVTVFGRGFGQHSLELASTLGPNGWIEQNPSGTYFPEMEDAHGWSDGQACFGGSFISDEQAYSGSHSVQTWVGDRTEGRCDFPHCWQGAYNYDRGESFERIFASFRIRFDPIDLSEGRTQWKLWRVNATGINGRNSSDEIYSRLRYNEGGRGYYDWGTALYCRLDTDTSPFETSAQYCAQNLVADPEWVDPPIPAFRHYYANYHHHVGANNVGYAETMPAPGTWNRMDVYLESSAVDEFDGAFTMYIHRPGEHRKLLINVTGLSTHSSMIGRPGTEGPWRYWVFQNYIDDDGGKFASERANVFIDDIYLQFGTRARVEVGDQPTYAACKILEVQEPGAWEDTSISVALNRGRLPAGKRVFLFVVLDDGSVSDGYPVTFADTAR